jgi:hypothetical protein
LFTTGVRAEVPITVTPTVYVERIVTPRPARVKVVPAAAMD